tara:strand:- start:3733 stop:4575 length:843 start_codon:yes stop_codon:yes gene_type:complete
MENKIAITGSSGTIGNYLVHNSLRDLECLKLDYRNCYKQDSIFHELNSFGPNILIHCAAPTDLDEAEKKQEIHYEDIFMITKNLVDYCKNKNITFIYMSSTGVYGNWKDSSYEEEDKCIPTSYHHKCKHKAEEYILNNLSSYFILRLGWIFSSNFSPKNHDFVSKIYDFLNKNKNLVTNQIQKGVPTPTCLVDEVVRFILEHPDLRSDTINVVSSGQATRMEYISAIQDFFETKCIIEGTENFSRDAKVSDNETASNKKLSKLINKNILDWKGYIFNIEK